jgi:glycerophosphoryl diester phosphodiesterase
MSMQNIKQILMERDHILQVAHRGFHPENKMIGFRQAMANGCDMIECDLRLSADNHPVVIHDRTINRTTNGRGHVANLKLYDLEFYGVPSLEELLLWLKDQSIYCAFELKDIGNKNNVLLNKTLELIQKHNMLGRSMIISFNHNLVKLCKQTLPDICTGIIIQNICMRHPTDIALKASADAIWVHHKLLPLTIDEHNMPIFIWTVNNRKELRGVDRNVVGIVSDDLCHLYNRDVKN